MLKVVPYRPSTVTIDFGEYQLSPEEQAACDDRRRRWQLNADYLSAHQAEFAASHAGQFVCVAGGEAFIDPSADVAINRAWAAHPNDCGETAFGYIRPGRNFRI